MCCISVKISKAVLTRIGSKINFNSLSLVFLASGRLKRNSKLLNIAGEEEKRTKELCDSLYVPIQ